MTRARLIDIYQKWQGNYRHQDHHDGIMIKLSDGKYVAEHSRVWEQAKEVPVRIGTAYLRSGTSARAHVDAVLKATVNDSYQPD